MGNVRKWPEQVSVRFEAKDVAVASPNDDEPVRFGGGRVVWASGVRLDELVRQFDVAQVLDAVERAYGPDVAASDVGSWLRVLEARQ